MGLELRDVVTQAGTTAKTAGKMSLISSELSKDGSICRRGGGEEVEHATSCGDIDPHSPAGARMY